MTKLFITKEPHYLNDPFTIKVSVKIAPTSKIQLIRFDRQVTTILQFDKLVVLDVMVSRGEKEPNIRLCALCYAVSVSFPCALMPLCSIFHDFTPINVISAFSFMLQYHF